MKAEIKQREAVLPEKRLVTIPIFLLMIYVLFTFLPIMYTYMPFWGRLKIVLLSGIGLLLSYVLTSGSYSNVGAWRNSIFYAWIFFLITLFMGLIVSYDRGATLQVAVAIAKYTVVIAIMVKIIDSHNRLDLVIKLFVACGLGMALSTIINKSLGETFEQSYRATGIQSGIFADPNDLALFLNSILPFLLYYFVTARRKIIPLVGSIIVVIAVILTYSRGGFLGMAVIGIGFTLLSGDKSRRYIVLALIGAILFWVCVPDEYRDRISSIKTESRINETTGKYPGRLQAWVELLPKGMESPILGVGAGNSYYVAGKYLQDWHGMHNSFLQAFLEAGILGFICYATLYFLPFRQYLRFKSYRYVGSGSILDRYRFSLLSLTGYAVSAFFLPQAYSPILFFLSALALIQSELISRSIELTEKVSSSLA